MAGVGDGRPNLQLGQLRVPSPANPTRCAERSQHRGAEDHNHGKSLKE